MITQPVVNRVIFYLKQVVLSLRIHFGQALLFVVHLVEVMLSLEGRM